MGEKRRTTKQHVNSNKHKQQPQHKTSQQAARAHTKKRALAERRKKTYKANRATVTASYFAKSILNVNNTSRAPFGFELYEELLAIKLLSSQLFLGDFRETRNFKEAQKLESEERTTTRRSRRRKFSKCEAFAKE